MNKLKTVEEWKKLNNGKPFTIFDYIYQEAKINGISTDSYFALSMLFWPDFIEYKGYVFLKENFSELKFNELKNKNIELWMNLLSIDPYFEKDEDQMDRALTFSKTLKEIWETKLNKDFPKHRFSIVVLEDKNVGDIGLTFYQGKFEDKNPGFV